MEQASPVKVVDGILLRAQSDAVNFERSIESEQDFRRRLNGVNVESQNFRVRDLLGSQIEKLQQLLALFPTENTEAEDVDSSQESNNSDQSE